MRATVMRDWQLRVDDLADPTPGPGQVLTKVLACGICGSDLHMLQHGAESRRLMEELTADRPPDPMQIKMFVRKPAALRFSSRSTPMMPPQKIAIPDFKRNSLSR